MVVYLTNMTNHTEMSEQTAPLRELLWSFGEAGE
jgi:hypothetical protein